MAAPRLHCRGRGSPEAESTRRPCLQLPKVTASGGVLGSWCLCSSLIPAFFSPVCLSVRPFVCLFLCRRFFEGVSHSGSQTEIGSLHSQKGQDQESGSPVSYTTTTTSCPFPSPASPAPPQCPHSETTAPGSACLALLLSFFPPLFPSTGRQVAMGGIPWGRSQRCLTPLWELVFCEARHGSLAAALHRVLHPALTPLPVSQGEADKRKPGAQRPQEEPGTEVPAVVSSGYGMWSFLKPQPAFWTTRGAHQAGRRARKTSRLCWRAARAEGVLWSAGCAAQPSQDPAVLTLQEGHQASVYDGHPWVQGCSLLERGEQCV